MLAGTNRTSRIPPMDHPHEPILVGRPPKRKKQNTQNTQPVAVSAPLDGKFLHQYQPRECDIAVANRPSNKPVSLRERKEPWNIGRGVSLGIFESLFGFLFACFGFSMCFTCFFCMFPFILKHFREAKIQQKQEKQKKYPPKEKEFKKNTPSIGTSEHAGPCKLHVPLIASLKMGLMKRL